MRQLGFLLYTIYQLIWTDCVLFVEVEKNFLFFFSRADGRATGTVCRPSSVCTECIVAKRCVLEQKLLLSAYRKSYEKSIGTKMNDLDLCLEVVSRSCQPLPLRDI